jgi:hypothetical protein
MFGFHLKTGKRHEKFNQNKSKRVLLVLRGKYDG